MWFGTDDGLNRYDGYNFHVYKNNLQDGYSISNNTILTMNEDNAGDLWIGTRRGLNRYDRENDRFIRYSQFAETQILSIKEDEGKNFWIGTSNGTFYFDIKNDSVVNYSVDGGARNHTSRTINGQMSSICIDARRNVWIFSNDGLHLYDKESKLFINYYHDENDPNSLSSNDLRSILEDRDGRIWNRYISGFRFIYKCS